MRIEAVDGEGVNVETVNRIERPSVSGGFTREPRTSDFLLSHHQFVFPTKMIASDVLDPKSPAGKSNSDLIPNPPCHFRAKTLPLLFTFSPETPKYTALNNGNKLVDWRFLNRL